jgi:RNA polymerase primary sigma factor
MAAKDIEETKDEDQTENAGPMLDMSQAATKKMIATAKAKGYITIDELNKVLPPEQVSSEQIEDVMSLLSAMGVNVVEEEEAETEEIEPVSKSKEVATTTTTTETLDRTDDPVRMYLREMGSVELLSREGEIAIAKRIEAGRNTMIAGLCESPLTFQAITIWHDELLSEDILLRDVIDLETTFGDQMNEEGEVEEPVVATTTEEEKKPEADTSPELDADGNPIDDDDDDDDEDEQVNMSLAAMEAALKETVLTTLEQISSDYAQLS